MLWCKIETDWKTCCRGNYKSGVVIFLITCIILQAKYFYSKKQE